MLSGSKGGLFLGDYLHQLAKVILVEGVFDVVVLWQAGFRNATCPIGTHLTPTQLAQLCKIRNRLVYIAFDQDKNQAGQQAARTLAQQLVHAGLGVRIVNLPANHDPNSYFTAGATANDFAHLLEEAQPL